MRLFLALASGFALTLGVFAAGAVLATVYLAVPTQERDKMDASDSAAMWSNEPVRVAYAPGPSHPQVSDAAQAGASNEGSGIGLVTTAAAATGAPEDLPETADLQEPEHLREPARPTAEAEMLATAHLDWCRDRYRSYRPEDNSYRPYGGGRAFCVSPYLEQLDARSDEVVVEAPFAAETDGAPRADGRWDVIQVSGMAAMDAPLTDEHIRYCFDRYRSYRPEDNSYQPYGGGPRRQCM